MLAPIALRILYVDDDAALREGVASAFAHEGCPITTEADALRAAATDWRLVDLLITDYSMPAMDGLTLVERARAAGFAGPVILFSGSVLPAIAQRAQAMGLRQIVDKGDGPSALLRAVRAS
ncbi:MAG: response regulator [Chthoniobacterales bacterium]